MVYATVDDLIAAYGAQEVIALTDRKERTDSAGAGTVDAAVAQEALTRASSEADTYIAVRYALPLSSVPAALKTMVCDIARFRLTGGGTTETMPIVGRYTSAIAWLKEIASGGAVLPGATLAASGGSVA
jgi:phage gp36-like protein